MERCWPRMTRRKSARRPAATSASVASRAASAAAFSVSLQGRAELDLAPVAHAAHAGGADHGAALDARRAGRAAHGIVVVVVAARLPHEVEEQLVHVAEPVAAAVRPALDLVPHDAVAQDPALLVGECEGDAPGDAELALAAVGVAEVEPQRSGRLEHAPHLGEDGAEGRHVVLPAALGADAAAGVAPVAEVRRARQAAVDGGGGEARAGPRARRRSRKSGSAGAASAVWPRRYRRRPRRAARLPGRPALGVRPALTPRARAGRSPRSRRPCGRP